MKTGIDHPAFQDAHVRMEDRCRITPQPGENAAGNMHVVKPFPIRALPDGRCPRIFLSSVQRLHKKPRRLHHFLPLLAGGPLVVLPQQGKIARAKRFLGKIRGQPLGMLRYGARHRRQYPNRAPARDNSFPD